MLIIGHDGDRAVFRTELDHGVDPLEVGRAFGYATVRPLSASRAEGGKIELTLSVVEDPPPIPVRPAAPMIDPTLDQDRLAATGEEPLVRRRIGAYGLITSDRGLLATEFSDRTTAPGFWGLAGGGIDDHEQPADALLREVHEETGQQVTLTELIMLHTSHGILRSPSTGVLEDLHSVRLVYRAFCAEPTDPVVHDVGGTTSDARWISLDRWTDLPWAGRWTTLISAGLGG